MLVNKEKRLKYLGFNDFWFSVVGILTISLVTAYFSNYENAILSLGEIVFTWGFSIVLGSISWLIGRTLLIFLHKKYPDFKDDAKRIGLFFLAIVATIFFVNFLARTLIALIPGMNYVGGDAEIKMLIFNISLTVMIMAVYEAI